MSTETVDPRYLDVDRWPSVQAVEAMLEGQLSAVAALRSQTDGIAAAAEAAADRLFDASPDGAGRLIYAGAGTSGRVAVQDGVELAPTYNWPEQRTVFLMAGGMRALTVSVEGAEDDADAARAEVAALSPGSHDVLIGIAASGRTPYPIAAIETARDRGALTIAVTNNRDTRLAAVADHAIVAETGSEIVAGSTRMKAGTAQKAALNLLSTTIMLRLGLVHRGRMVNMRVSNAKLLARGRQMVADLANVPLDIAAVALDAANRDIRMAVLVARGASPAAADRMLADHAGDLGAALRALAGRTGGAVE